MALVDFPAHPKLGTSSQPKSLTQPWKRKEKVEGNMQWRKLPPLPKHPTKISTTTRAATTGLLQTRPRIVVLALSWSMSVQTTKPGVAFLLLGLQGLRLPRAQDPWLRAFAPAAAGRDDGGSQGAAEALELGILGRLDPPVTPGVGRVHGKHQ